MDNKAIQKAQEFLMINDGKETRILLDIEILLKRHHKDKVVEFLDNLVWAATDDISDLLELDRTSDEIDKEVSRVFRLKMAIRILREEVDSDDTERGTRKGG